MRSSNLLYQALCLGAYLLPAAAVITGFSSEGCVDPAGFDSCWSKANAEAASLTAKYCTSGQCTDYNNCYTPDQNCAQATICLAYTSWINCVLQSCWNRAYGCEYQQLAINAASNCDIANNYPPYFPPPRHGPGYCSCNMGFVYQVFRTLTYQEYYRCSNNVLGGTAKEGQTCDCCSSSSTLSTFYNACPDTDPAELSFFGKLGYGGLHSAKCATDLSPDAAICAQLPYNYTYPPGPAGLTTTWYNAATLPANGTQPLSDNPGELTTPAASVLTWSLYPGGATVATAAPYVKAAATSAGSGGSVASASGSADGAAATATSAGGAGQSSAGMGTGTAATTTPKAGVGATMGRNEYLAIGAVFVLATVLI